MELKERLNKAYEVAVANGMVKTWSQFAKLLSYSSGHIYGAKSGNEKFLTESLVRKAELAVKSRKPILKETNVQGDNSNYKSNSDELVMRLMDELQKQRELTMSLQLQNMKLLTMLEDERNRTKKCLN